jgi:hypothetical protein
MISFRLPPFSPPREEPRHSLDRKLGGPQSTVWTLWSWEKSYSPCGGLNPDHSPSLYLLSYNDDTTHKKKTPWSESASELYRPSDSRLSAKWLPTCADRGCHVVSVTHPSGRILGFLDRSRYFLSSSSSVVITKLSGPRSKPTTFFFLVVPGIEPGPPDL